MGLVGTTLIPADETGGAGATSAAPGAGSAVVNVTVPPAGEYKLVCTYAITGTTETSLANLRLKWNNTIKITGLPTVTSAGFFTVVVERATIDGTNNIRLEAVAASTAGSVYTGAITYTRLK